jgi:hypothetical protein
MLLLSRLPRPSGIGLRRPIAAACIALLVAGCTSGTASPTPAATSTVAAATATPVATETPSPALTPAPTPTAAPSATANPTPVPTPLPPLAVGLCKSSQLKLIITSWIGDGTADSYAHVTAINKSSASCNMRGSSEARIVDGRGYIIADAGHAAAKASSSDTLYKLTPGGKINTILDWANWCKAKPAQKVFVAMVEPFGLGGFVSDTLGDAPIPFCYSKTQPTTVKSEAWLP